MPTFTITPAGTWLEQWQDDTNGDGRPEQGPGNLAWFAGEPGTYVLTAVVPCGAKATYTVVLGPKGGASPSARPR